MARLETVEKWMLMMAANYANYTMNPAAPDLYYRILSDVPDDLVEAAAIQIMSNPGAFFPSSGDWRKIALDLQFNELAIPTAYEAWEEVQREIRRCSDYYRWRIEEGRKDPVWSTPLVEKAVACIGYQAILEAPSSEISYIQNNFYKTYDALKNRWEKGARMLPEVKQLADKYTSESLLDSGTAGLMLAGG